MKIILTASLVILTAAASFAQPPTVGNCTVLPANNVWNTPVDTLPVSSNSATYIATIGAGPEDAAECGPARWINGL